MPDSNIPAILFECRRHHVGLVIPNRPAARCAASGDVTSALTTRITANARFTVREGLLVVRRVNRQRDAKLSKLTEPLSLRVRANDYLKNGLLAFIEKHAPEWTGR